MKLFTPWLALASLLLPVAYCPALAQGVGIGTTSPAASAALEVSSSTQGFLPPRLTQAQRDAIRSPAVGLTIFNTAAGALNVWDGTQWTLQLTNSGGLPVRFAYTGAAQTYTVPEGISSVLVDMTGAAGGNDGSGKGGRVQATLAVTAGQVLTVLVGGTRGYNGGGRSSGGGASDIRTDGTALSNRVLVAGGGGGGGYKSYGSGVPPVPIAGGAGGGLTGGAGGSDGIGGSSAAGGSQTAGGAGAKGGGAHPSAAGGMGTAGQGGGGSGGGGGGGYYGGGGGSGGTDGNYQVGGGGGGSSYAGAGTSNVVHTQGYQSSDGYVLITANVDAPAPRLDATNFLNLPWTSSGNSLYPTAPGSNVGIGTTTPTQKLEVAGQVYSSTGGFRFPDNTVQTTAFTGGDNLGNHTATQNLNLGAFQLVGNGGTRGVSVSSGGNVGISTTAPTQLLELGGQPAPNLLLHSTGNALVNGAMLQWRESNLAYGWNLRHNSGGSEGGSPDDRLVLESLNGGPASPVMSWNQNSGNVGIGTTAPAYPLDVAGVIRCTSVTTTSDARLKTQVRPLTGALAAVLALRGVRYRWNALGVAHGGTAGAEQVGLLAQELEQVYPELVSTDAQGYKAVNYAQLTPVLLEALKEQQLQIQALQAQVAGATRQVSQATAAQQADHADLQTLKAQLARLLGEPSQASAR